MSETHAQDQALDPGEAAALLEETRRRAERRFDRRPPWLLLTAAAVVLVCYGAPWLSVRDQHPYGGPAGWSLGVLYGTLAVWAILVSVAQRRATTGVGGRAARRRTAEVIVFAAIWICVYVFQGALAHAGVGKGIVYGIWPAVGPLLVVGPAAAAYGLRHGKWANAGFAVAAVALGAGAAYAGPAGVWGVVAVGLSALLVIAAASQLLLRRAAGGHA